MMIGNNIMSLLYMHDISQKQMAVDLEIAPSTLNGYINNRREPDFETLIKIANYFNVSCDYLIGNSFQPEKTSEDGKIPTISKDELKLLHFFQLLTDNQKELIMAQAQLMCLQNSRD